VKLTNAGVGCVPEFPVLRPHATPCPTATPKVPSKALGCQPHLLFVVTAAASAFFFRGQIRYLRDAGFRVSLICSPGPELDELAAEGAEVIPIRMHREIAPFRDFVSLYRLWRTLQRIRPDIINVGTPKAGLLGGIAARLALVPRRIYTLHGLRLETARGWTRRLLLFVEYISCRNAQYVRCVSQSLRERAVQLGVVPPQKAYVIGAGSANGLSGECYEPSPERRSKAEELRQSLGIAATAPVIGFVGRLTRDKGVSELYGAYHRVARAYPDLHLLLVGQFEDGDPVDAALWEQLQADANVHFTGRVSDTAPYYAVMDVLTLPTYREGLGQVSLEGQASGVPVVTTTATGAIDSVLDGVTGILVPPRDEAALTAALIELLGDPERRQRMGKAGLRWVSEQFRSDRLWSALAEDYRKILQQSP
jgi:glycosyltransferase involved in cell wall biosynthesis